MPPQTHIKVTSEHFSVEQEYQSAANNHQDGAIVFFVGKVRDLNQGQAVNQLTLEHYPGMTERVLHHLAEQARSRFVVNNITIIHRVGTFALGEEIVLVIVSASHRHAAFMATEYIMDLLKSQAPFWKREVTENGARWLSPTSQDNKAPEKWMNKEGLS
ncbi:molybdopterin synthase catalytic subunit MoaE [Rosenbergiella sp. S61]|uniref:Molybdopterin synthase catalytic subunit n=1 Tax=Rosenbergiella gaditana TaxID=2726987 RepID=A0ABS5SWI4_9GAMM|nr:molybdopterin synthase catalytic subunit MoaE [Rosenbergiella gaditana]MBT0724474.1 molybdopterin synthase catalytic subunit MoaE [Rosenbergiella gaditana]